MSVYKDINNQYDLISIYQRLVLLYSSDSLIIGQKQKREKDREMVVITWLKLLQLLLPTEN